MAENGTPGVVGSHGEYHWLTMVDCDISTLLRLCPDVVLGKYLAITSIDSGTLHLTERERDEGWWTDDAAKVFSRTPWSSPEYRDDWKVACSPRLSSVHGLPDGTRENCCGFNEWYVFEHPVAPGEMEVFVNWGGFTLYDPDYEWCADRLWEQMARLAPESCIVDGTVFTLPETESSSPASLRHLPTALTANPTFQIVAVPAESVGQSLRKPTGLHIGRSHFRISTPEWSLLEARHCKSRTSQS
jgi:hypothetical protein